MPSLPASAVRVPAPVRDPFFEGGATCGERLALLSTRERTVADLAAEGRTDEQIAQTLGLSLCTVNSYWVRIRGKLGPLGRAEIIAGLVRHEAYLRHTLLVAENHRLFLETQVLNDELESLRVAQAGSTGDEWHGMALVHSPEATFVVAPPANVVFANRQARRLFLADVGSLEGRTMRSLSTSTTPEAEREPCRTLFEDGIDEETVGIEAPYFAQRSDGSNFRAVLHARKFTAPAGPMAVVTVREYLADVDAIVRALRQPLAFTGS